MDKNVSEPTTNSCKPVALVLGGTGLIGGVVLRKILASNEYARVYAISRKKIALAHSHLDNIVDDMTDMGELLETLAVDDIFCCLGTTMKKAGSESRFKEVDLRLPLRIAEVMRRKGSRHFLVISAIGANRHSLFFYNRVKGELEYELKRLAFPYLTILQPSLLLGDRDESRIVEKVSGSVFGIFKPLMVGKFANIAPIPAEDVASRMVLEAKRVNDGQREAHELTIESGALSAQ